MDGPSDIASPPFDSEPVSAGAPVLPKRRIRKPRDEAGRKRAAEQARVRRAAAKLNEERKLRELRAQIAEARAEAHPVPREPTVLRSIEGGAATSQPNVAPPVVPGVAVRSPSRPGWPSDDAIAAARPTALSLLGMLASMASGIVVAEVDLGECFSGTVPAVQTEANGDSVLVDRPKVEAIADHLAPLLAKYGDTDAIPMELTCIAGAAMIFAAPFVRKMAERKQRAAQAVRHVA